MKRINATKGGRRCSFRIDQLSDVRLLWARRVGNEFLKVNTSPATIIRRALDLYCGHLEGLLEASPGDIRIAAERGYIRKANRDNDSDLNKQEVLKGSLRSLRQMQADKNARKPKLIDILKADLLKWSSPGHSEGDQMPD